MERQKSTTIWFCLCEFKNWQNLSIMMIEIQTMVKFDWKRARKGYLGDSVDSTAGS